MLGKHDPFKVVLDPATDPGADKRGLLWSGQVPAFGKDTGGACFPAHPPAEFLPQRRWRKRDSTHFSLAVLASEVKPSATHSASQSRKAWGVDTPTSGAATTHHTGSIFRQRVHFLPAVKPKNCPANQK